MASGNLTPPATPPFQQGSEWQSSISPISLSERSLRSTDKSNQDGSSSTRKFDTRSSQYVLDGAQVLGSGLWSTVYLAPVRLSPSSTDNSLDMTPPSTPERLSFASTSAVPNFYAVKVPSRGDAPDILAAEARILTQLSAVHESKSFLVPFHGLDPRNGNLVMGAVPMTLDNLIEELAYLGEAPRQTKLERTFPSLALHAVRGMAWLHDQGIVHGDIKPSNILLSKSPSSGPLPAYRPLYCDFSASHSPASPQPSTSNAAAGTWSFLSPELLSSCSPSSSQSSDIYALGITLLTVVLGESPFKAVEGNRFMLRNAINLGDPLRFAREGELKRMRRLEGWEVWMEKQLQKKAELRGSAEEWAKSLEKYQ
ncbi:MAG: hypothetical protein M1820_010249 [Bogoriella megaspora]|nr:MAG: hypothetical protein M1820_010249 [Bogoriella megaspora]